MSVTQRLAEAPMPMRSEAPQLMQVPSLDHTTLQPSMYSSLDHTTLQPSIYSSLAALNAGDRWAMLLSCLTRERILPTRGSRRGDGVGIGVSVGVGGGGGVDGGVDGSGNDGGDGGGSGGGDGGGGGGGNGGGSGGGSGCGNGGGNSGGHGGGNGGGDGGVRRPPRRLAWSEVHRTGYLGSGAFCHAFAAEWRGLRLALKILRPEAGADPAAVRDLEQERELLGQLQHDHVVRLIGGGEHDGCPFLLLERVEELLSARLPNVAPQDGSVSVYAKCMASRRWPFVLGLRYGLELAKALRHLHAEPIPGHRVLHRDLKPDNCGFMSDGRLVLLDFGVAKLWRTDDGSDPEEARALTAMTGAVRYMAPEVYLGQSYNYKAEVHSYSILLWQMLSRRRPFHEMNEQQMARMVMRGSYRPPITQGRWPTELERLIRAGWDREPQARPSFEEVVPLLEHLYLSHLTSMTMAD